MTYPIPANETQRLAALKSYAILDTPTEQEYDDLVALAAQLCGVPIALISLVDESRQWFKAERGFGIRETPRTLSFCAHALTNREEDVLIVPDATQDARFKDYANVTGEPHIRFYAGAPLITSDGVALGTLCVIDRQPRDLTPEQLRTLRVLRRHVVNALELRRLAHQQRAHITELRATQQALETARAQAEAATQAKSLFLATMTHEIRTPMNAVMGMATLLQDTSLDATQRDCVDTIRTSGEILLTLINDILDHSKIEAGRLELECAPFLLTDLVHSATKLLLTGATAKGLQLITQFDPGLPQRVGGDLTRLRQILVNLLSNAVKFTPHGSITITARTTPRPDGQLTLLLAVTDTGIGIPPDRLGRLFQAYSQAEASTTREYGGTGLGLAISRRLAELHGGGITVESTPGRGSTFNVQVVVAPADDIPDQQAPRASKLDASHAARHPARVLIVEDNPINQKVATYLLRRLGYQPQVASNGLEALDHVAREPFDLVLMDGEMPGMNGPLATERIRQDLPADRQPVVVALTAHSLSGGQAAWDAAGADGYLAKPLSIDELLKVLVRLPELKRSARR